MSQFLIYDNLEYIDSVIEREKIDKLVVLGDLYYSGFGYNDGHKINSILVKDFLTKYKNQIKKYCSKLL